MICCFLTPAMASQSICPRVFRSGKARFTQSARCGAGFAGADLDVEQFPQVFLVGPGVGTGLASELLVFTLHGRQPGLTVVPPGCGAACTFRQTRLRVGARDRECPPRLPDLLEAEQDSPSVR